MSALNVNRVCLAGHLTRDPMLRKTAAGVAVADLGMAINESYKSREGKTVEQTCFVDVAVWARSAEVAHAHLHKGDPLLIEGSLFFDQWESDKGERRSRLRVRASRLHFVGGRRNGGGQGQGAAEAAEPAEEASDAPMPF